MIKKISSLGYMIKNIVSLHDKKFTWLNEYI